jgi:hypothetical protein
MATATSKQNEPVLTSEIRAWARTKGIEVGVRGRLGAEAISAWNKSHRVRQFAGY